MPTALYFKPSYERVADKIATLAPDLDIALYDEDGSIEYQGRQVSIDEISPDYFWIHVDLFKSARLMDYFDFMKKSDSIRWLHTINTGLDMLPYMDLLDKGVRVSNNHGQAIAIAEYVFGQLFAYYQKLHEYRELQQQHVWKPKRFQEIQGRHWVIVGFGHIGQELARRAKSFGVSVTAVRRSQDTAGLADQVCSQQQLADVLPQADVVVLACTSNQQTRNMVDAAFLAKMKESSVLVNVARGDLVVEEDLHKALDQGNPAFAVLDTVVEEPVPAESWLWDHPRVALTAHTSNGGNGFPQRSLETFLDNLQRISQGLPLLNLVSREDII